AVAMGFLAVQGGLDAGFIEECAKELANLIDALLVVAAALGIHDPFEQIEHFLFVRPEPGSQLLVPCNLLHALDLRQSPRLLMTHYHHKRYYFAMKIAKQGFGTATWRRISRVGSDPMRGLTPFHTDGVRPRTGSDPHK